MNILDLLTNVADPRMEGKVKHNLGAVLFVGLCGVLSGCESWSDIEDYCETKYDWLSNYVDLENGIPSEWTFRRVFTLLDPAKIEQILTTHATNILKKRGKKSDHIAIDGKALCGSKRKDLKYLQSISAWCHENSLVLGEREVEGKSNEIAAISLLIEAFELKGTTVTIDAAGCQKAISKQIKEKKGEYVLGLKKNHPKLYEAATRLRELEGSEPANLLADAFDNSHGRRVRRRYFGYDTKGIAGIDDWCSATSIIAVETISSRNNAPE